MLFRQHVTLERDAAETFCLLIAVPYNKSHFDSIAVSSYNNEQKNVNTTVIRVKWDDNLHVIKGESVAEAFKSLIAFLLENGLMTTIRLVFFIEGASSLKRLFRQCSLMPATTLFLTGIT